MVGEFGGIAVILESAVDDGLLRVLQHVNTFVDAASCQDPHEMRFLLLAKSVNSLECLQFLRLVVPHVDNDDAVGYWQVQRLPTTFHRCQLMSCQLIKNPRDWRRKKTHKDLSLGLLAELSQSHVLPLGGHCPVEVQEVNANLLKDTPQGLGSSSEFGEDWTDS